MEMGTCPQELWASETMCCNEFYWFAWPSAMGPCMESSKANHPTRRTDGETVCRIGKYLCACLDGQQAYGTTWPFGKYGSPLHGRGISRHFEKALWFWYRKLLRQTYIPAYRGAKTAIWARGGWQNYLSEFAQSGGDAPGVPPDRENHAGKDS